MSGAKKWKDVNSSKTFEEYILYRLKKSPIEGLDIGEFYTGNCAPCSDTDHCIRWCADIKGTYNKHPFVIDAKYYESGRYISEDDISKLKRDMKNHRAQFGFLITFGGNISSEKEQSAGANNIFTIHVRNDEGNPKHWIKEFTEHFE